MNKIVKVQFGNAEINAGSENELTINDEYYPFICATKRDETGRVMQRMILGPGCIITYQEVEE